MTNELIQTSKFILYTSPTGDIKLDVFIQDETFMADPENDGGFVRCRSEYNQLPLKGSI